MFLKGFSPIKVSIFYYNSVWDFPTLTLACQQLVILEFYQCGVERFIVSALPSALLQHLFIFSLQRTRFVADRKKFTRLNKIQERLSSTRGNFAKSTHREYSQNHLNMALLNESILVSKR